MTGLPPYYSVELSCAFSTLSRHKIIQGFGEEIVVSEGLGDVRAQAHHHMRRFSSSVRNQLQFEQRCWDGGAYYKAKLPSTLTYVRIKKKKFQSKKKLPTVLQINRVYDFVQVYPNYSQGIAWSDSWPIVGHLLCRQIINISLTLRWRNGQYLVWNVSRCIGQVAV